VPYEYAVLILVVSLADTPQLTLFNIVNSLVRAGPEPKEAVLSYIGTVIALNRRRAGIHVRSLLVK